MSPSRTHIVAIDQGTTGTTALCLDPEGRVCARGYQPFPQHYPQPGWVEHNPEDLIRSIEDAASQALTAAGIRPNEVAAVGIANQRETVVVWDAETGQAVDRAIVWQCRRTTSECARLRALGLESEIRERSGLLLDPYFSAAKIAWLLDAGPGRRNAAAEGKLLAGTVECWLTWRLTGRAVHAMDVTNASRTSLMNLRSRQWDDWLLETFRVPRKCLPAIVPSAGPVGVITEGVLAGAPITGMAGDQQAALFGHRCCSAGQAKNTYGTGCFLLVHTGNECQSRDDGILTTAACGPAGEPQFAWEGSVFIAGAAIQWLRDELGVMAASFESEAMARSVPDSGGVVFVPAFTGLGAPHWDPDARGAIFGLTRGSNRDHLARAALEAMALQTADLVDALAAGASGAPAIRALNVDGGASANGLLMQIQADLLDLPVLRAAQLETTALGAGYLAGVGAGIWKDVHDIPPSELPHRFDPAMSPEQRESLRARWSRAVGAARQFGS